MCDEYVINQDGIIHSRVFTAKCSDPQAESSDT